MGRTYFSGIHGPNTFFEICFFKSGVPITTKDTYYNLLTSAESDQIDLIELKLDNSRKEAVRAMKLAWEAAEPGRHLKGYNAKNAYLSSFEGGRIPNVDDLMSKTKKGRRKEDPDIAIKKFTGNFL